MRLKNLFADEDAVSPVIGVILMVAITVILAAVIASVVLGVGQQAGNVSPQASFTFDWDANANELTVIHDSGDDILLDEVTLRGTNFSTSGGTVSTAWDSSTEFTASGEIGGETAIAAGDRTVLESTGSDYEINVVWESRDGDSSTTLASDEGPDA